MDHYDTNKIRIKFERSFLNQFSRTILHGSIVSTYTVYEITSNYNASDYPNWKNWKVYLENLLS